MGVRRAAIAGVTAIGLGLMSLTTAPAAGAAASPSSATISCGGSVGLSFSSMPPRDGSGPYISVSPGDTFVLNNSGTPGDFGPATVTTLPSGYSSSGSLTSSAPGGSITITVGSSNGTVVVTSSGVKPGNACGGESVSLRFIIESSGGGSSGAATPAPQTFELAFTPSDGTVCTRSSESGTGGTWITLPGASDCTPPATKPNAKLLGWATSPTFPVSIAKRQVDNGWGAYETFNADGQLTGVFIPAGGATFLSAAGNIYPIWNQ